MRDNIKCYKGKVYLPEHMSFLTKKQEMHYTPL